jgi:hypothetical protein
MTNFAGLEKIRELNPTIGGRFEEKMAEDARKY